MPTSISHLSRPLSLPLSLSSSFSDPSMSLSALPDLFLLPFEELDGEDDEPETLAPSDPADPLPDWGCDDFFVCRRSLPSGSNHFSRARPIIAPQDGLRIVDSDSETDTDEQIVAIGDLSFRWECLPLEQDRRVSIEYFEWEDVFSPTAFSGDFEGNPNPTEEEEEEEIDLERRSFEWEVLLAVNNTGGARNGADSVHGEDQEGFDYALEYEVLFDRFDDHGGGGSEWIKCGRPAAKSVLDSLPSVLLTAEDVAKNNALCAICNDEISLSEKVKRLPCLHHYHGYCILPWLVMRNTCPLCRYELPASDASEEEARARGMIMEQRAIRKSTSDSWKGVLVSYVEEYIREILTRNEQFIIRQSSLHKAEVDGCYERGEVDTEARECTCRSWQPTGLSCIHAATFISMMEQSLWHTYVDQHYHVNRYKMAYEATMPVKHHWELCADSVQIGVPKTTRPRGRPRKNRIKSFLEKGKKIPKCSHCGLWGHHKNTCKSALSQNGASASDQTSTQLDSPLLSHRSKLTCRREPLADDQNYCSEMFSDDTFEFFP